MVKLIEEFSTLSRVTSSGKIYIWKAYVVINDNGVPESRIEYGYKDGKQQLATKECAQGKNIGKANETTPLEQCIKELKSEWNEKKDKKGYTEKEGGKTGSPPPKKDDEGVVIKTAISGEKVKLPVYPMLAQKYDINDTKVRKNSIKYPCFVQPKFDGIRCLMFIHPEKNKVVAYSRSNKEFESVNHITSSMEKFFAQNPLVILDGELYTDDYPFEQLAGLIMRQKKGISKKDEEVLKHIKYFVYDIADINLEYKDRFKKIEGFQLEKQSPYLKDVKTVIAKNIAEFKTIAASFIGEGYEGAMLRNVEGKYRMDYRSYDLQKYKEFQEEEFEIVGFKQGEGREKGAVLWVCQTKDGKEFTARPVGSIEDRKEIYENAEDYIGKMVTIKFQEYNENGVPRFGVVKAIREGY